MTAWLGEFLPSGHFLYSVLVSRLLNANEVRWATWFRIIPMLVYVICNSAKHFKAWSPYDIAVGDVKLDELVNTPSIGYDYYTASEHSGALVYGHAARNGKLTELACAHHRITSFCLLTLLNKVMLSLPTKSGLESCSLAHGE